MDPHIESILQLAVETLLGEDVESPADPAELVAALREFADAIEADIEAGAYDE